MLRGIRKAQTRLSDADRARALAQVNAMAEQGLIRGDDELNARRQQIGKALYDADIRAALANLPRRLKQADLPASDADRQDAIRQVRLHESVGHLTSSEAAERIKIIYTCRTQESIAAVLADLPDVEQPQVARRISQRDRDEAVDQLNEAFIDGRITSEEHTLASAQVERARTRQELSSAFRGLTNPAVEAARKKAVGAGRTAAKVSGRVSRRVLIAFLRWILAVAVAISGVVTITLGYHLAGGILLAVGVVIWVSSVAALFASRRR